MMMTGFWFVEVLCQLRWIHTIKWLTMMNEWWVARDRRLMMVMFVVKMTKFCNFYS